MTRNRGDGSRQLGKAQGIHSIEDLERKAKYYFQQHNEVIPLDVHNGGIPLEVLRSSWNDELRAMIENQKQQAIILKKQKTQGPSCGVCPG